MSTYSARLGFKNGTQVEVTPGEGSRDQQEVDDGIKSVARRGERSRGRSKRKEAIAIKSSFIQDGFPGRERSWKIGQVSCLYWS